MGGGVRRGLRDRDASTLDLAVLRVLRSLLRQLSVGGDAGRLEVEAYVLGLLAADTFQHDLLAQASTSIHRAEEIRTAGSVPDPAPASAARSPVTLGR